ncbi:MAG: hypothetical protein ACRC4W_04655 [Treponemataceae bacterium]
MAIGIQSKIASLSKFKILCLVVALSTAGFTYNYKLAKKIEPLSEYKESIAQIESFFKKSSSILNSADTASIAVSYGFPVNDSGQSEYYLNGTRKLVKLFYKDKIQKSFSDYQLAVHENIQNKKYDYIFIPWIGNYILPSDFSNYYELETILPYRGILNGGNLEIWRRIN